MWSARDMKFYYFKEVRRIVTFLLFLRMYGVLTEDMQKSKKSIVSVLNQACADGTSEGFHDATNFQGCAGSWKGHIRRASKQLCGPNWRICTPKDRNLLMSINSTYMSKFGGCFTYNAAQVGSKCRKCQNKYSMAALGRDCQINEPYTVYANRQSNATTKYKKKLGKFSLKSRDQQRIETCFEDRVVQAYSRDFLVRYKGLGCLYSRNGIITGVLCCRKSASNHKRPLLQMDLPTDVDGVTIREEFFSCYPICRNGGICLDSKCVCKQGFFGHACQHGGCYPPCSNGGLCLYGFCRCRIPFYGEACEFMDSENSTIEV